MLIKNKKILFFCFLIFFLSKLNLYADEFNISASEITIDQENNIVTGLGDVEVFDNLGKKIKAEKVVYKKNDEFLTVEGMVEILDEHDNIIKTDKATYDKLKGIINTFKNSELELKEGYTLRSDNLLYNNLEKIISSDINSILKDSDGNTVFVNSFQYLLEKDLFSSIGKIKIIDVNKNKYFFKELHVKTQKKEMIGSDVSVVLDQENFGVSKENDPRFVANDVFISKNRTNLSKGVFTVCKKRDDKCPPWSIKAKKITHDKAKKTIYYEHATLKVYDIPIFYFPKFFHPDPTVKRQSGFLFPFFTDSTTLGAGFGLPYYWAISHDKDLTFTPKFYTKEKILFLNEYRQAFANGFLTLDTSYTEGYKNTTSTKTAGSRNHIFAELDFNLGQDDSYESNLSFKIQNTSNDTYFRIHDIDTALVDSDNTNLENKVTYNFNKDNTYLDISGTIYEDLREKTNSRYEYVLPNILFGKSFFTEKFGTVDFKSNAVYKNYKVDKHTTFFTNDIIWNPNSYITGKGFVNSFQGLIRNTNYEAKNTTDHKTEGTINELSGVIGFKSSLPMKKQGVGFYNTFSPTFMTRYAPGHMRDLRTDDLSFRYANLFSINKTSTIEDGLTAILGFDFKTNKIDDMGSDQEKLSISMGQVFSPERNKDLPAKSSLDQKMSDVVGEIGYNFSEIGKIDYKFALDHNLNDINYNEVSTSLNFGKVAFNLDYLEEQNHVGNEHYANAGISLNFSDNNTLSFETRKNFKRSSSEFYDINYQYNNDCLTAGIVFRREFYEDSDVEPKDSLMFTISFVPFTGFNTPAITP
tara:strand:+ start:2810 stop:5233 length:2424 start_codon:yes stop_codon:yes gene_type:complete